MPEYTHSLSLAVSRTGKLGMLQLSPYYRRTVGSWDQVRTVDEAGVSTVTWQNLATITSYGARATASVRQLGRVSGLVSVSAHREVRDASNLREDFSGSATRYSASSTLSLRATSALSLQGALNYMPARYVPQGRISPMVFSTAGARLRLWDGRGSINVSVVDPFELQRFTFTTRDGTHVQTGSSTFSARRATMGVSYSFGRPPESNRRTRATEESEQDDRAGRRIR
jgi:ferric enterobactin receptor